MASISVAGRYNMLMRQIVRMPVTGEAFYGSARITDDIMKIYQHSRGRPLERLPCIKCHLNGLEDVSDVQIHQVAYKALIEYYHDIKTGSDASMVNLRDCIHKIFSAVHNYLQTLMNARKC